ncbi:hypothetical protein CC85DRAFT_290797 [Cutaneotrichosporon oleaginosum]|uniref:Uncharacterized protein n=1 Tax=Cutaneotrichosporon oleaginosum TaxID=879819 RepID=A0A0J0XUJ9_9TREE|nr:uncharacterized protein CC85DRAFT_290797 [Cutaneotrichosporon oleaginosum]KLT44745.1 hypothetical protein CC85DRAFT_290797 [Cutaneotrichosporon oleaginosum]TXT07731.1 hypothetical protein COLE_04655 [Cutaneotrichosporon oleaginosum]
MCEHHQSSGTPGRDGPPIEASCQCSFCSWRALSIRRSPLSLARTAHPDPLTIFRLYLPTSQTCAHKTAADHSFAITRGSSEKGTRRSLLAHPFGLPRARSEGASLRQYWENWERKTNPNWGATDKQLIASAALDALMHTPFKTSCNPTLRSTPAPPVLTYTKPPQSPGSLPFIVERQSVKIASSPVGQEQFQRASTDGFSTSASP